jgi:hypothetical protein
LQEAQNAAFRLFSPEDDLSPTSKKVGCDILIFVGSITSITADLGSLTDQQTNLRLIELDQLPISPQRAA